MFWKLFLMIMTIGATASTLLVMRQQRLDLLSAQAITKQRIIQQNHEYRSMRLRMEEQQREEQLHTWMAESNTTFSPIPFEIQFEDTFELPIDLALQNSGPFFDGPAHR